MHLNHKTIRILSIAIGTVLSIGVIIVGFRVFSGVFTRAADEEPQDVVINEISQNTAKIAWTTGNNTQGVVEYGTSQTALNFFAPEAQAAQNHTVELTLLSPGSTYFFQIRIGDKKYDNKGIPWTFTTKSTGQTPDAVATPAATRPSPTPISSIVIPDSGTTPVPVCGEVSCTAICNKLGKGCSTSDLVKKNCIGTIDISTCTATSTSTPSATPAP